MTIIQRLHEIQQMKERKEQPIYSFRPTRPDTNKQIYFNDFQIPTSRSLKYTKERLSKVLAFVDSVKQIRFSDGNTVMPISCTNQTMLSITGSTMNASNLIKYMKEIGLISEYDNTYQYKAYYNKDNKSKTYVYNYENEIKLKEYCRDNNINKYEIINNKERKYKNKYNTIVKSFDNENVRFNSKQHLLKPENYSVAEFEDYLGNVLDSNYPQLKVYKQLADNLNKEYYSEDNERRVSFTEKFTWSKGNKAVRKIGIRATNSCVSAKKEREEDDEDWIKYRDEYLQKFGLNYEFDVKSSVPRITYLLNHGIWLDNDIDLYEMIFKRFIELCPEENMEWNEKNRRAFKSIFMRGYFDSRSMITTHTKFEISKKIDYKVTEWKSLNKVMKAYKQAIEDVLGKQYDSEIFLHESCIYMDVLKELLKRDYDILQVYDGFYFNKECKEIENIIKCKSLEYYYKYINKENNNNNKINKEIKEDNINTIVKSFNIKDIVDELLDEKPVVLNTSQIKIYGPPQIKKEKVIISFRNSA